MLWIARLTGLRTRRLGSIRWPLAAVLALRLIRSWNQTGQKFAGEPDIVKTFLVAQPQVLWLLVQAAYIIVSLQILANMDGLPYVAATGIASLLVSSAFSFKLAFTTEDAPELVVGFAKTLSSLFTGQSLVSRARIVFALVTALTAFAVYRSLTGPRRAAKSSCKLTRCLCDLMCL